MALPCRYQPHLMNLFSCGESLFRTKCHVSRDIAHLHLNIEANQKLIDLNVLRFLSLDQNQDLLDSVHRWNHTITSDAWQKSHRSVGIGPAYINQELEATIGYMDTASYYYHKGQYGQDLHEDSGQTERKTTTLISLLAIQGITLWPED